MHESTSTWIESLFLKSFHPSDIIKFDFINNEIFPPNHFYGNAACLKRYSMWPLSKPLKAVIQHGPYMEEGSFTGGGEIEAPLAVFWPPTLERAKVYSIESGGSPSIPIGLPYLYIIELLKEKTTFIKRKGTLVFPGHSTKFITKVFNHKDYIEKIMNLPSKFHPVSICVYWRDYELGYYKPYEESGFNLVSAGHMNDPDFMANLYILLRQHQYSCSNEAGSHIIYSLASETPFFMLHSSPIEWQVHEKRHLDSHYKDQSAFEEINQLFAECVDKITSTQLEFVNRYLGVEHLKDPEELYHLFELAEKFDWMWPKGSRKINCTKYSKEFYKLPCAFRRMKWIKSLFRIR